MMGSYYGVDGWYGYGFGLHWIFTILFWALILWLIVSLMRGVSGHGCCGKHHHGHGDHSSENGRALDILKERYAKGEISKEEFDRMKQDVA